MLGKNGRHLAVAACFEAEWKGSQDVRESKSRKYGTAFMKNAALVPSRLRVGQN
jgi:hypothetical protein